MSLITTNFFTTGVYEGKTITLGGRYPFENGKFTLRESIEQTALHAQNLERNWSVFPEGHPALQPVEGTDNGERDSDPNGERPNGASDVPGASQPKGARAQTSDAADDGSANARSGPGETSQLADGHGHATRVNPATDTTTEFTGGTTVDKNGPGEGDGVNPGKGEDATRDLNLKLKAAVEKLDPADDSHWTAAGKPAISAVANLYGAGDVLRADIEAVAAGYTRDTALERATRNAE